jgi:hypothetical protein
VLPFLSGHDLGWEHDGPPPCFQCSNNLSLLRTGLSLIPSSLQNRYCYSVISQKGKWRLQME